MSPCMQKRMSIGNVVSVNEGSRFGERMVVGNLSGLAPLLGSESALAGARFFRKDRFVGHELLAKHGSTTQRTVLTASGRSRRRVGALGRSSLVGGLDFVPRNLGVLDRVGSRGWIVTREG